MKYNTDISRVRRWCAETLGAILRIGVDEQKKKLYKLRIIAYRAEQLYIQNITVLLMFLNFLVICEVFLSSPLDFHKCDRAQQ